MSMDSDFDPTTFLFPEQERELPAAEIHFNKVVIYGVGLLGGSLGQALLHHGITEQVVGLGRSSAPLEEARRLGAISAMATLAPGPDDQEESLAESLSGADLVVLCTPVEHIRSALPAIGRLAPAGCIITDVGSTKARIVEAGESAVADRHGEVAFVGCHPMAGSDRSGVAHSRPDLFHQATVYLTPTRQSDQSAVARLSLLWRSLGSRIILCRPERHDELASLTSHMPFIAATSVVQALASSDEDRNLLRAVVAGGFRDTTRIAKGHPEMWRDILRDNRSEVLGRIQALRQVLDCLEKALDPADTTGDGLRGQLAENSQFRSWFDEA